MLSQVILTAVFSYFSQKYFPWWTIVFVSIIFAIIFSKNKFYAFCGGFIGVALLNTSYASIINSKNASILSKKIMSLMPCNISDPNILIILTGIIFGLVGGISAFSGSLLKSFLKNTGK